MEPGDLPGETRLERKKKETRQKIIKVAMDLFQRQGFNNTTMEQIATEADIARKTLYNHFPVKEAIVDEYVRDITKEMIKETFEILKDLPDTRSRLLVTLDKVYEWVEINPEITGICMGYRLKNIGQGTGYVSGGTQSLIAEIIDQGQRAGEIRRDISVKLVVTLVDLLRGAVVMDWLNDTSKFDLRQEMAKVVDLILCGVIEREENQNRNSVSK